MAFERDAGHAHQSTDGRSLPVAPDGRDVAFSPGMRVRLEGAPINTTLTTPLGTVIAEGQWDTYIVRLDSPATYHHADGTDEQLDEIRILRFNLMPIN